MEKEDDNTVSFCPSFSCYTGGGQIVETAERVRLEYSDEYNDEFEFINLREDCDFVYPIFNQILITHSSAVKSSLPPATVTTQLRDLFLHDSSDEKYELEGISSEMYCLWTPEMRSLASSSSRSSSTSTCSRRWRIRDLLKRCYSKGKQTLKRDEAIKKEKEKVSAMEEEEKRRENHICLIDRKIIFRF